MVQKSKWVEHVSPQCYPG